MYRHGHQNTYGGGKAGMKITKIYIENFGTISDYSLELKDGINTVLEDNGWGKSTLANFVRIMFYGLEGDRSRKNIRDNERNLYRPWNGGTFGGSIEFESVKGKYILTRTFGTNKKEDDTFSLRDASTGKESSDYSAEDIGKVLFGLDSDSYQKTSFIGHDSIKYSGVGSEVGSKVSSAPQAEDIAVYDNACELMKNYLNSHSPKGVKGSLSKQKNQISELKREIERIDDITRRVENEKNAMISAEEAYESLLESKKSYEKEKKSLIDVREKALKKKTFLEKQENVLKREKKIEDLKKELGTLKPDEELVSKAEGKIDEISALSVKLETRKNSTHNDRFERLRSKYGENIQDSDELGQRIEDMKSVQEMIHAQRGLAEQIDREKEKLEIERIRLDEQRRERENLIGAKRRSATGLLVIGVVVTVLAICTAVVFYYVLHFGNIPTIIAGAVALAGLALIIVGAVGIGNLRGLRLNDDLYSGSGSGDVTASLSQEIKEYDLRIKETEKRISDYLDRFDIEYYRSDAEGILHSIKSEIAEYRENLKAEKNEAEEIGALAERGKGLCAELKDMLSSLGIPGEEPVFPGENKAIKKILDDLKRAASEGAFLAAELEKDRKDLAEFEDENPGIAKEVIPESKDIDIREKEIDDKLSETDLQLDAQRKEINEYSRSIEIRNNELEELMAKKDELANLTEEYEEEFHRYGIVKKTEELLGRAKDALISRYMAPLRCSFEKYYDILKGSGENGNASDFLIDTNLEITKKELGNYRDIRTLSDGTGDRIGLCMRAAFLDVMYADEKPIVILDDPFSNLDKKNIEWGWRYLDLLSKEYQIIYMTCHANRVKA